MTITKKTDGNSARLILDGRLDTNAAVEFEKALTEVATPNLKDLVIDMIGCGYMASSGLRVIANAQKYMDKCEGSLTITNVCEDIMEVFDMTGLTDLLKIEQI